jgi:glycosyltransferase involved in cell wall biosynthesis
MINDEKEKASPVEDALISVIIPVYNGGRYVAQALDSVFRQEHKNIEIIAVNDGSTDGTEEILRSYSNVRYLYQSRKGASKARNEAVKCSSGEFIAFIDADDLWTEDKLRKQKSCFISDPDLDMVFGYVEQFFSPELEESLQDRINISNARMPGYLPGAMLVKRSAFLQVGFFDEGLRLGEFVDWYVRAVDSGLKSFLSGDVVLKRRIHDANSGIREREHRKDYLRVLKASLDRRRETEKKVETSI